MAGHAEGESGLEKGWRHGQLETLWRKGQSLHYELGEIINHEDEGPLVKSYKNVAELVTEMRAEGREYPRWLVREKPFGWFAQEVMVCSAGADGDFRWWQMGWKCVFTRHQGIRESENQRIRDEDPPLLVIQ